jgi:acyl-CoA thioester hydrolase
MPKADFKFSFPIRVRYAEIDGQGIVFNAHYLTYFDTALGAYFRAARALHEGEAPLSDTYFHTVRNLIEYRAPIGYDAQIEVFVRTARLGQSSLTLVNEIYHEGDNTLLTFGESVWVNAAPDAHKSVPLPDDFRELLRQFEGAALDEN